MKRLTLAIITLFSPLAFHLSAQTEVSNFTPGVMQDGVNYFLPQTALRITVVAEKTVTTPGELNKYAFRYLRLQDVPATSSTTWKIKSVSIDPYGVPDPQKAYNVKLKAKTLAPLVSLTHDGLLLSINTEAGETSLPPLPQGTPAPAPLNPKKYMSQEMLSAGSKAKLVELCAQEIYDVRDSRNALVRGEADNTPKDGAQLKLMLDQLDTQDKALTQLFCGSTVTSTEVFSLNFLPTQEIEKAILFRFSQFSGMVDADDLSGQPVYISIKSLETLPQQQEALPSSDSKLKKLLPTSKVKTEKGIYYNVPAREAVRIFDVNQTLTEATVTMGQFGHTEILSDALFDKKLTTRVTFYQETGALKKLDQ